MSNGAALADVAVLAQHGGRPIDAVFLGDFAYVAQGSSVVTLRLADGEEPLAITAVSESLEGSIHALAVHQDRLYVAWEKHSVPVPLAVFSLADPSRPLRIGPLDLPNSLWPPPSGLAVLDDVLYVASGNLISVDLSDPDHPIVGSIVPGGGRHLEVYGKSHIIAYGIPPFYTPFATIYDASAPLAPVEVGDILGGGAFDLDVGDGYIVVADSGFSIYDLTDVTSPTFVASRSGFSGRGVELVGDQLLVADGDSVRTWDLSDLAHPVEGATLSAPVAESRWATHDGERALVLTDLNRAVQLDVSRPSMPQLEQTVELPVGTYPMDLEEVGSAQYVVDGYRGLRLLDDKLRLLADLDAAWPNVTEVAVYGDRALLAEHEFGIHYVDVSTPVLPGALGSLALDGVLSLELGATGGWAVTRINNDVQLVTLDLATPSSPQVASTIELEVGSDLHLAGDVLYVGDGRLRIFDVTGALPLEIGQYVGCQVGGVDVRGSVAALTCLAADLQMVDVSNPAAPVLLGSYNDLQVPVIPYSVLFRTEDELVYIGSYGGMGVIDVSNPARPVQVDRIGVAGGFVEMAHDSDGGAWGVGLTGGLARIRDVEPAMARIQESGVFAAPQILDKPLAPR